MNRVIKFNQKSCLKTCIDMDTELRKMLKNEFGNNVFRLMNFF